MIIQSISDRLEVLIKQTKKHYQSLKSKLKTYLTSPDRQLFVKETVQFILFYGLMINLATGFILGAELSIINVLACGATYYVFLDVVKVLSDERFVLFGRGLK